MNETLTLQIDPDESPIRIDRCIAERVETLSRSRVQSLIEQGLVRINGNPCLRPSEKVLPGDALKVVLPTPAPSSLEPQNIPLEIIFQDDDIAVINKPPGLSVHPAGGRYENTLVNALLYHIRDLSGIGGELRPGIVHRLDRVTSGIMLVAKHDLAHQALSRQFKDRRIHKTYWAIVHGAPSQPQGEIDLPIARHPTNRKIFHVDPEGRPSITRFETCGAGLGGTWLAVYPLTGRTHQIRVHLKHYGCPIVGDATYATRRYAGRGELERVLTGYSGIALHARELCFDHKGAEIRLQAEPPSRLLDLLRRLE